MSFARDLAGCTIHACLDLLQTYRTFGSAGPVQLPVLSAVFDVLQRCVFLESSVRSESPSGLPLYEHFGSRASAFQPCLGALHGQAHKYANS
eukprot:1139615-Pelagomonas_calceolata.AAC.2